jgi:hypothetical protein
MAPTISVARGVLSNAILVYPFFLQEPTNITRQLKYYEKKKSYFVQKTQLEMYEIVKF